MTDRNFEEEATHDERTMLPRSESSEWLLIAIAVDRIAFLLYVIIFASLSIRFLFWPPSTAVIYTSLPSIPAHTPWCARTATLPGNRHAPLENEFVTAYIVCRPSWMSRTLHPCFCILYVRIHLFVFPLCLNKYDVKANLIIINLRPFLFF